MYRVYTCVLHMLVMRACERPCIYVYWSVHVIVHTYSCRTHDMYVYVYTGLATVHVPYHIHVVLLKINKNLILFILNF